MNTYIREYLRQVKLFFPILGRPERMYMRRLEHSLEDYFQEHEPESVEEIVQVFDRPQDTVRNYLSGTEVGGVVRRARNRRVFQTALCVAVSVALMATITFGVGISLEYKALRDTEGYLHPVYSAETGGLIGYAGNDGVFHELD